MKKRILFSVFMIVTMIFFGSGLSPAQAEPPASTGQPAASQSYVPGELVVGFDPNQPVGDLSAQADSVASSIGATVLKSGFQGMTLLQVPDGTDINALSASLKNLPGVRYVEPNYFANLIDPVADTGQIASSPYVVRRAKGKGGTIKKMAFPISGLKAAKMKSGSKVKATYPNDPSLWTNWGWSWVGADAVWTNTTASKNVCVLDTGVDYLHPDLAGKIIKGFDFVNFDLDPMDDYGHGTHVAGIISAVANNKQGLAGVSTGKVVAVKVLDANGSGTSYDVAQGIIYCANRADINIINLSLGGDASTSVRNAVDYAVNPPVGATRTGKLVVAAAGNDGANVRSYPAAYSDDPAFLGKVMAVAAAGKIYTDPDTGQPALNRDCQASYSTYGTWVNFVAPGTNIYSTTPWDKPFYMHEFDDPPVPTRYASLSGTSMATPFVAGIAARAWGYLLSYGPVTNADVEDWLYGTGWTVDTTGGCWAASMNDAVQLSLPGAMERGVVTLSGVDANTDLPLVGATVSLYLGSTLKASAIITAIPPTDPLNLEGVDTLFTSWADLINLPAPYGDEFIYTPKISAANHTASAQKAFVSWDYGDGSISAWAGYWEPAWAVVPQKSAHFTVVGESTAAYESTDPDEYPSLVGWTPDAHPFVINPDDAYYNPAYELPDTDVAPYGSMSIHPYARWLNYDWHYQSILIRNRTGLLGVTSNAALPAYTGIYNFAMTDNLASGDTNLFDTSWTSAFIWKDGVIKWRVDMGDACGDLYHWWVPFSMTSGPTGSVSYTDIDGCRATPFSYPINP